MKFNKQELQNLACQSSNRFVKEGTLLIYERQDGILFKRNESKRSNFFIVIWYECMLYACYFFM